MSKAVSNGAHWLPRAASFSLHGQRNGRVEVLAADGSGFGYWVEKSAAAKWEKEAADRQARARAIIAPGDA
jgi:hypothetical protein